MIELQNINFSYRYKRLFNDLSLKIEAGKIYGLIGKNGAGKTSLLKLISGLLFPDSGDALIYGKKNSLRHPDLLSKIFFIPESFFLPDSTGKIYTKLNAPFYPYFSFEKYYEKLNEFSIDENILLTSLSFGQKKKFMLAFAFASGAKILLFDEPTNGLDIPSQKVIRKILAGFTEDNRTVIISTHHFRELENIFDEIIVLDNGKIILQSEVDKLSAGISIKLIPFLEDSKYDVIFAEKIPGGYSALVIDENAESNNGVIEYLLNAVLLGEPKAIDFINKKMGDVNDTVK